MTRTIMFVFFLRFKFLCAPYAVKKIATRKLIIIIKTFILLRERGKIDHKCPSVDINPTISQKKHRKVIKTVNDIKTD